MKVIHLGSGARREQWIEAVERFPGARNVDARNEADVAVITGSQSAELAAQALLSRVAVILDEPGILDGAAFRALRAASQGSGSTLVWPRRNAYAGCQGLLRRLTDSGRLGGVGHVSCLDHAVSAGEGGQAVSHVSSRAFAHFEALQQLFGARPRSVMAHLGSGAGAQDFTEAFIEYDSGLHIHYSGFSGAPSSVHELWIEGAEGSAKTDGRSVRWRKRGWHFFVPLNFGLSRASSESTVARATLNAVAAARHGTGVADPDLTALATVAAAVESDRRRESVSLSEFAG